MNHRNTFVFYRDWYDIVQKLDNDTGFEVCKAIMAVALGEECPKLSPVADAVMLAVRPQIERDIIKYQEVVEKRRNAGKKHKGNQYTRLEQYGTNGTSVPTVEQTEQVGTNGSDNVYDNDIVDNNSVILEEKEDTNVSPKKNDYQAIIDCWNEHNGKRIAKVTSLTDKRKKAIKKQLDDHKITQYVLMRFFASLPYADKWLYNPTGAHKTWKPNFDWWMANTNSWLTKGLEGGVHIENPIAFERIMNGADSEYTPQGRTIWFNEETKSYWSDDNFYYGTISDGYDDESRPDGATLTLNNARGDIRWNGITKQWEEK